MSTRSNCSVRRRRDNCPPKITEESGIQIDSNSRMNPGNTAADVVAVVVDVAVAVDARGVELILPSVLWGRLTEFDELIERFVYNIGLA